MIIIVDTNIVFSALLNTNSNITKILLNKDELGLELLSVSYLKHELEKHFLKIQKFTKLTENELVDLQNAIFSKIEFVNEELLSKKSWLIAEELTKDVDNNDMAFVALTYFLRAKLWTGDKKLINALKEKDFNQIITTNQILDNLFNM